MPELPEVETIRKGLQEVVGKKLFGKTIKVVSRKGKMLFLDFVDGSSLAFHLKLTGQLLLDKSPSRFTRKVFNFSDGSVLLFNDARKFGWYKMVKDKEEMKEVKALGPDPLQMQLADFKRLFLKKRKVKIKPLLMNQGFIAGIGNIYADEILFAAGILPIKQANTLKEKEIERLFFSMEKILQKAIKQGGSSVENYLTAQGEKGSYAKYHKVYQKTGKPCVKCGTPIKRIVLAGRGTHYCPCCQK